MKLGVALLAVLFVAFAQGSAVNTSPSNCSFLSSVILPGSDCNTTLKYVHDKLVYLNATYAPSNKSVSTFLFPTISLSGLAMDPDFELAGEVLQNVVTGLDQFLFGLAGKVAKLPCSARNELYDLICKLLPCIIKTSGPLQILVAFLIAELFLTIALVQVV